MSTKIYNAYLYKGTLLNLQNILMRVRNARTEYWLGKFGEHELRSYYSRHTSPLSPLLKEKCDDVDREAAVIYPILHPDDDSARNAMLVQFFGEHSLQKRVRKIQSFYDFHYQNQTDPPDDIYPKSWEKRGKIWDRIFDRPGCRTPAQAGFTFSICSMEELHLAYLIRRDRQRESTLSRCGDSECRCRNGEPCPLEDGGERDSAK